MRGIGLLLEGGSLVILLWLSLAFLIFLKKFEGKLSQKETLLWFSLITLSPFLSLFLYPEVLKYSMTSVFTLLFICMILRELMWHPKKFLVFVLFKFPIIFSSFLICYHVFASYHTTFLYVFDFLLEELFSDDYFNHFISLFVLTLCLGKYFLKYKKTLFLMSLGLLFFFIPFIKEGTNYKGIPFIVCTIPFLIVVLFEIIFFIKRGLSQDISFRNYLRNDKIDLRTFYSLLFLGVCFYIPESIYYAVFLFCSILVLEGVLLEKKNFLFKEEWKSFLKVFITVSKIAYYYFVISWVWMIFDMYDVIVPIVFYPVLIFICFKKLFSNNKESLLLPLKTYLFYILPFLILVLGFIVSDIGLSPDLGKDNTEKFTHSLLRLPKIMYIFKHGNHVEIEKRSQLCKELCR